MASGDSCAVDPHQLLKALSTLLTPQGQIKSCEDMTKILNLMKSAKKLVSRCIYINILRATEDKEVMDKFVADGGWELLNGWLQEAKTAENTPVILELIKVFKHLPVTIGILKRNNTAKLIKQMTKGDSDEKLKEVANELVDKWLSVIRNHQPAPESKTKDKPPIKKLKIKKVEKKDSDNGEESKSKPTKRTASDSQSSDSKQKVSKNERTKDVSVKSKQRRDSIDDDVPLSRLKKMHQNEAKSPVGKSKSPAGKTEEVRKRPRTAKVPQTKFRSTGLEKETPLPPIKIKKKAIVPPVSSANKPKPVDKLLPVKREGPIFSKSLTPPDKKPKTVTSPTQLKAKLIPPKPKAQHHIVQESSIFMNALNAPAPQIRKKRRPSKPTSPTTNKTSHPLETEKHSKNDHHGSHGDHHHSSSSHAAERSHHHHHHHHHRHTESEEAKPEPPKFGFYAAIQQDEEKKDSKDTEEKTEKKEEETKTEESPAAEAETNGVKKKKSVRWRPESNLVEIRYFEMDVTERVNVNKAKDFQDAAHNDIMMERQSVKNAMRGVMFNEDGIMVPEKQETVEYMPWRKLVAIDLSMIQVVDFGCNSKEKDTQKQREMVRLAEIYFNTNMIPESPQEPDSEPYNPEEPKIIPLEDETSVEAHQGMMHQFHPDVHHTPPQQGFNNNMGAGGGGAGIPFNLQNLDIPPDIQQILQQIPLEQGGMPGQQGQQQHMQGNEQPQPNATITNVQNLLSSMMDNQGTSAQEDLTNRLREMLEPFKHQIPGMNMGQGPPNQGMPPPDGMVPQFGNPGDFGGPPQMMGGPGGMPPRGGMLPPPPFQDGQGPQGMGPQFGGPQFDGPQFNMPGGPQFDGPGGPQFDGGQQFDPQFDPQFQGGPNFEFGGPHGGGGPGQQQRGRGKGGRGGRGGRGRGRGQGRPVCRHFMSPKGCMRGNSCMFYHPGVHGPPIPTNGPVPLLPNPH